MLTNAKSSSETQKTDDSLRNERSKTDSELEKRDASTKEGAASLLLKARQKADQVLEINRDRANAKLDQEHAPAEVMDAVKEQRIQADSVLEGERDEEDLKLSDEYPQRMRALAEIFNLERRETDSDLQSERAKQSQQSTTAALALDNLNLRLETQAKMLEQAVGARDSLLSLASDELRTPLTSLQLQMEALLKMARAADGMMPPGLLRRLSNAEWQVRKLEELTSRLLDASHPAAETTSLETVNLSALTREIASRMVAPSGKPHCELVLEIAPRVEGEWDNFRLVQVITSLVDNALKYGAGKAITVSLTEDAAVARLCVHDQGIGIDPQHHQRIFRRFERAVSDRSYGGFGLGLWIVKQQVDALGGKVTVSSQLGSGATFTVELPTRRAIAN